MTTAATYRARGLKKACAAGLRVKQTRADARNREREEVRSRATAAETVIYYACDAALCTCPPMPRRWANNKFPLDVIFVGRDKAMGIDRCLHCGTAWTLRMFRSDPSRIVSRVLRRAA